MAATRLIVVSDLHLGGSEPCMMSRPDALAAFVDGLPARLRADERLDLVIAGDFVDFLAMPPGEAWTADPADAADKLARTVRGPFSPVFQVLGRHLAHGHERTVIVGNHDVELALPPVQAVFEQGVAGRVRWVDDGRAYRVGGALVEHGNRYDEANLNDWEGLRAAISAWTRDEALEGGR